TTTSEGHGHVRFNMQASARGRCLRRNELAGLDLGVAFSLAPLLLSQVEAPGHQPGLRLPLQSVDMTKGKLDMTGLSAIGVRLSNPVTAFRHHVSDRGYPVR